MQYTSTDVWNSTFCRNCLILGICVFCEKLSRLTGRFHGYPRSQAFAFFNGLLENEGGGPKGLTRSAERKRLTGTWAENLRDLRELEPRTYETNENLSRELTRLTRTWAETLRDLRELETQANAQKSPARYCTCMCYFKLTKYRVMCLSALSCVLPAGVSVSPRRPSTQNCTHSLQNIPAFTPHDIIGRIITFGFIASTHTWTTP